MRKLRKLKIDHDRLTGDVFHAQLKMDRSQRVIDRSTSTHERAMCEGNIKVNRKVIRNAIFDQRVIEHEIFTIDKNSSYIS